jgi:hypothetical protein
MLLRTDDLTVRLNADAISLNLLTTLPEACYALNVRVTKQRFHRNMRSDARAYYASYYYFSRDIVMAGALRAACPGAV